MAITNYYQKCLMAGIPVIDADDILESANFSRPMTDAERLKWIDIVDEAGISARARHKQARITVAAIPSWATWTQADWQTYFNANLSDAEVDKVATIAQARVALKRQNLVILNLVKMVLALRDKNWPDL